MSIFLRLGFIVPFSAAAAFNVLTHHLDYDNRLTEAITI